jgi:hypothetical protein
LEASHPSVDIEASVKLPAQRGISRELSFQAIGHEGELVNAFRGSQGVFLMTPLIAPPEANKIVLGKQQADAVVETGVQHVIFSALEYVEKITDGMRWAPHFTDKARIEEYLRRLAVASSFVHLAFFYTNSPTITADVPVWAAGIVLWVLRASWPIVVCFARIIAHLAMPGVAISDRAFESTASAIH